MAERFKFEEIPRPDGLIEEQITEEGEKDYPMRRSVGMPLFGSDEERKDWMWSHGEDETEELNVSEGGLFELRLKDALARILIGYKGDFANLETVATAFLASLINGPGETFQLDVAEDATGFSVKIDSAKHGKLEFKIQ